MNYEVLAVRSLGQFSLLASYGTIGYMNGKKTNSVPVDEIPSGIDFDVPVTATELTNGAQAGEFVGQIGDYAVCVRKTREDAVRITELWRDYIKGRRPVRCCGRSYGFWELESGARECKRCGEELDREKNPFGWITVTSG